MESSHRITAAGATIAARRSMQTMYGYRSEMDGMRQAHDGVPTLAGDLAVMDREARENSEDELMSSHATRARGAGNRPRPEEPDPWRTCFERDRDRILHKATAFRRLAGKTQVFIFPEDHQRTRLTHALEVAQVARAIATALRLNVVLAEAIALGHDCGHGPFGHASEDALDPYVQGGFDHAPWGADVTLAALNLTFEVTDGIRNHSWSRPVPATPEGEVCALADRIAYTTHDAEDAARSGIVTPSDLPPLVKELAGSSRSCQLRAFITDVVVTSSDYGAIGMSSAMADALGQLRAWNYERIYLRPESVDQSKAVIRMLRALVEHFASHPGEMPDWEQDSTTRDAAFQAVAYVAGMTDRFACGQASKALSWPESDMPRGIDLQAHPDTPR